MIGYSIKAVKTQFFDARKIDNAAERATLRALSKFGAFVRQRSRHSIRKRKGVSEPGQPPHSHTGLLREHIYFVVERAEQNVVIGPAKINKPSPLILQALEYGGNTAIMGRGKERGKLIPAVIEARPVMQPAFDIELKRAPYLWENGLRA